MGLAEAEMVALNQGGNGGFRLAGMVVDKRERREREREDWGVRREKSEIIKYMRENKKNFFFLELCKYI